MQTGTTGYSCFPFLFCISLAQHGYLCCPTTKEAHKLWHWPVWKTALVGVTVSRLALWTDGQKERRWLGRWVLCGCSYKVHYVNIAWGFELLFYVNIPLVFSLSLNSQLNTFGEKYFAFIFDGYFQFKFVTKQKVNIFDNNKI